MYFGDYFNLLINFLCLRILKTSIETGLLKQQGLLQVMVCITYTVTGSWLHVQGRGFAVYMVHDLYIMLPRTDSGAAASFTEKINKIASK